MFHACFGGLGFVEMMKKNWFLLLPVGFGVSLLVGVFVAAGVNFVLYLLNLWQVSTVTTIILYALLFLVAKAGSQLLGRKPRSKRRRQDEADGEDSWDHKPAPVGFLTILWAFLGIYAILWLTPALILFWVYFPPYPPERIMLFVYLFSVVTSAIFYFINADEAGNWKRKLSYFVGVCLAPVSLDYLFY